MLPYFDQPVLELGPLPIHAFGVMVMLGVMVGIELASWRAKATGLSTASLASFQAWILVPGFVFAHVLDALWYYPGEVLDDPTVLLDITGGLSSFGGFVGALVGALIWRARSGQPLLPHAEVTLSVFPIAWSFGRAGCTLAHDHPGMLTSTDNPLAFAYPGGARWDLGFLEMLFSIVLSAFLVRMWRKPQLPWTYVLVVCGAYAPVRFALDFLRATDVERPDARYGGLTPAQWSAVLLGALAFYAYRQREESALAARRPA
jgi:phosphatidylglycerol---prolipoprotein diacylglyceryl transferase